ncbi:MAG: hypothetical protein JWO09_3762 [Bacteroidetes bacterium]|nr:hypothetical protein [Bacteroidota bacterium]
MKKIFSAFFIITLNLHAQITFQKSCQAGDNSLMRCAYQAADSSYFLLGNVQITGIDGSTFLIKTDKYGDTLFSKMYSDPLRYTNCLSAIPTADGGSVIMGKISLGSPGFRYYVQKMDSLGQVEWAKGYTHTGTANDYPASISQTSDGGFILCGQYGGSGGNSHLLRLDPAGNIVWNRLYGHSIWSGNAEHVKQTSDLGFIVLGNYSQDGYSQEYLVKTNSAGDTLWTRTYEVSGPHHFYNGDILQSADGGYAIVSSSDIPGNNNDIILVKTNSNGDILWTRSYGTPEHESRPYISETPDHGYVIGATRAAAVTSSDETVLLIKTDDTGNMEWTNSYAGAGSTSLFSVRMAADGGLIIAGATFSLTADAYLLKTNVNGNGPCQESVTLTVGSPLITAYHRFTSLYTPAFTEVVSSISVRSGISTIAICTDASIHEPPAPDIFTISPNPASGKVKIIYESERGPFSLCIYNLMGTTIYNQDIINSEQEIELAELNAGLYFIQVTNGKKASVKKLIIQ